MDPTFLSLQRESSGMDTGSHQPFVLSLRNPREFSFSNKHSFGLYRVPHIGVYGLEYTLCSSLLLLSLPAAPKLLHVLPPDLISALELDSFLSSTQPTRTSQNGLSSSSRLREREARALAQVVVHQALEAATRRVVKETAINGSLGECRMDTQSSSVQQSSNIPVITVTTDNEMDTGSPHHRQAVSTSPDKTLPMGVTKEESVTMQVEEDESVVLERRNLAKRLVFKCIRAACYTIMNGGRRDSIEYLISSTKRMRISSPSPTQSEEQQQPDLHPHNLNRNFHAFPLPPAEEGEEEEEEEERCLTPESERRQTQRKKRGRSESHEVTSLGDYDIVKRHLSKVSQNRRNSPENRRTTVGSPESRSRGREVDLGSLANTLGMMTIDEDGFDLSEEEPELQSLTDSNRDTPVEAIHGPLHNPSPLLTSQTYFPSHSPLPVAGHSPFSSSSPVTPHAPLPNPSPLAMDTPPEATSMADLSISNTTLSKEATPIHSMTMLSNDTTPTHSGSMVISNETTPLHSITDLVPDMDVYIIIHSCPPRANCQKFLCHNTNEINLVYHSWLFSDVSCDPHVTVSDMVKVGVFEPSRVQPVHLDLQDAGAPFYYMEDRSICIHSCCFSPDNAQLQLQDNPPHHYPTSPSPSSPATPHDFHSFFSAARHGKRRVVCLHFLPSSTILEQALKEKIGVCSTLNQLLLELNSTFPYIGSRIQDLVSTL